MNVFISWSGPRSRQLAELLRTWLADALHYLEPWMSSEDIPKGAKWTVDLFSKLQNAKVGIVCLTPENLSAPWILFEAGALGKALDSGRVCTLLFELKPGDIAGPLVQFQATQVNDHDMRKLVHALNNLLPEDQR